jgi:hypothetical protein
MIDFSQNVLPDAREELLTKLRRFMQTDPTLNILVLIGELTTVRA